MGACVLVVLAIGAFQVYDVVRRHQIVIETAERDLTSLVRVLAEQTSGAVQAVEVTVRDMAADGVTALSPDRQSIRQRLRDRIAGVAQVEELLVIAANGSVVATAGNHVVAETSMASRPYFTAHRDGVAKGLYISDAFRQPDGRWIVALSRVIHSPDGAFLGVAVAYLDLDYFQRFYAAVDLGIGRELKLVQRDGLVLVNYPRNGDELGRTLVDERLHRQLLAGSERHTAVLQGAVGGRDMIQVAQLVPGLPLAVIVSADKALVLAAWHVQAIHSAARTTLLCVSVMSLMWLVLRQLRRRERAEERLRVESAHLDELFESAPEAIVILDLKGLVTRVNREFSRMFSYTVAEACGRSLEQLIVPDDLRDDSGRVAEAVSRGRRSESRNRAHR